jgi:hypothetical protein
MSPLLLLSQDLGTAFGERSQQVLVMQPLDLRRSGALVDRPPANLQPSGEFSSERGVIEPVGGHGVGVQLPRV